MEPAMINEILGIPRNEYGTESRKAILQGLLLLNASDENKNSELIQILINHFNKEPA